MIKTPDVVLRMKFFEVFITLSIIGLFTANVNILTGFNFHRQAAPSTLKILVFTRARLE